MLTMSEAEMEFFFLHRRAWALSGLLLMVTWCIVPRVWAIGLLTGFMLVSLGIYTFALKNWRTDPGLWTVGALLTFALAPAWIFFELMIVQRLWAAPPARPPVAGWTWNQLKIAFDVSLALSILALCVRLVISVTMVNWSVTQKWARNNQRLANLDRSNAALRASTRREQADRE